MDRVFLRPQFAVSFRRVRRVRFLSEARSDYTALFLLEGNFLCRAGDEEFELAQGGALLVDPGKTVEASSRSAAQFLTLALTPRYVFDAAAGMRLTLSGSSIMFRSSRMTEDGRLFSLAHDLALEMQEEEAGRDVVITALVEQLLVHLLRRHANLRRSDELELSRVGLVDRRIRRAVEMMHAQMGRELPLEELAAAAYLSPFHFSRLFKKLSGASPHAYLANLRMQRAQQLLAETDFTISEISVRVGYSSPSHFSKAFRQSTGLSPRAFRSAVIRG